MNQLIVEIRARRMRSSVVKFMVKVKLIEKSVNSHVGRVMVVKVITQYRRLGMA